MDISSDLIFTQMQYAMNITHKTVPTMYGFFWLLNCWSIYTKYSHRGGSRQIVLLHIFWALLACYIFEYYRPVGTMWSYAVLDKVTDVTET